jgi:two-component system NtrC family sensor kinase
MFNGSNKRNNLLWLGLALTVIVCIGSIRQISGGWSRAFIITIAASIITVVIGSIFKRKRQVSREHATGLEQLLAKVSKGKREWEVTFDTLSEAVYIFDAQGKIIRVNKAAQSLEDRLRGYKSLITEFPGTDAFSLGLLKETEAQENFIRVQAGQDLSLELRLRSSSNEWIDLAITGNPVEFDMFEDSVPIVIVARDITEQKRLRHQLLQAEKMSAVGELVSGVAHELNNPLTTVIGFSQLLRMNGRMDEDDMADLKLIISEAERAREIVANLLTFARQTRSEKDKLSLNEVVEKVLALRAYNLRTAGITVVQDFEKSLPCVTGNFHQLQQVLLNIIMNAEQAMLESAKGNVLSVITKSEGDSVTISIADDGPGIDANNVNRIFDPFFTTKPQGKGTGLGLSISYGIIKEHGGDISVSSMAGQGSTFVITLPAVENSEEPSSPTESAVSSEPSPLSILIVDDEPGILGFLEKALSQMGHSVEAVGRVDQALELLTQADFDVIVSDVRMPGKDGSVLYQEAVALNPELAHRFIFMTGDAISQKTSAFLESINTTYISKPFRLSDMVALIEQKAARSAANSEPPLEELQCV